MYLEIADKAEVIDLLTSTLHTRLRAVWTGKYRTPSGVVYKGSMVFNPYGNVSVLKYVLEQFRHQAHEAGALIDVIIIGRDMQFPEGALIFERRGYSFENKTPNTGRCVEIF